MTFRQQCRPPGLATDPASSAHAHQEPAPGLGGGPGPGDPGRPDRAEQGQWWRAGGSEVSSFEREFAAYNGAPYALAVNSGTDALELALRVHGMGRATR
ncbi:hypothetical protein SCALM49S_05208 [Streptomyces californicus]